MKNYFSFIGITAICTVNSAAFCQEFAANETHFTAIVGQAKTEGEYRIKK